MAAMIARVALAHLTTSADSSGMPRSAFCLHGAAQRTKVDLLLEGRNLNDTHAKMASRSWQKTTTLHSINGLITCYLGSMGTAVTHRLTYQQYHWALQPLHFGWLLGSRTPPPLIALHANKGLIVLSRRAQKQTHNSPQRAHSTIDSHNKCSPGPCTLQ